MQYNTINVYSECKWSLLQVLKLKLANNKYNTKKYCKNMIPLK